MSEVVIGRRGVLAGLAALVVNPRLAVAQTTDASRIPAFYKKITERAFYETYGDTLWPSNISNIDDLNTALGGKADVYRENLILAVDKYVSDLGPDDQQKVLIGVLGFDPSSRFATPGELPRLRRADENLMSAFIRDEGEYLNGGRTYEINPLYAALHTLGQEGKITSEQANQYISGAREMAYPKDHSDKSFHTALVERVGAIVNAIPTVVPAAPGPAPSPFE